MLQYRDEIKELQEIRSESSYKTEYITVGDLLLL